MGYFPGHGTGNTDESVVAGGCGVREDDGGGTFSVRGVSFRGASGDVSTDGDTSFATL